MTAPGTLLDRHEIEPDVPGSRAWRVRFTSEDLFGRPTESTGVLVAPARELPDRPVITWCHGTTGLGDGAVPSLQPNPAGELITFPDAATAADVDRGVPGMAAYVEGGAVVVAPDYQGLGTAGFHHYAVHATGARDALNAARAAQSVSGAGAGTRVAALGWSEGGGMALGVAELPERALEGLSLRAVATFAPGVPGLILRDRPADLLDVGRPPDPHVLMFFSVLGWLFDDLDPSDVLTPEAVHLMEREWNRLPVHLIGQAAVALAASAGPAVRSDPQRLDRWVTRTLSASAGTAPPRVPVRIATGLDDVTVPPAWQRLYVDAATRLGGHVTVDEHPGEDHCSVPFAAREASARFLLDHLDA